MSKSLSYKIFLGLFLGLILGSAIQYFFSDFSLGSWAVKCAAGIGGMFVSLIKLMVIPLVYISIVCGVCELKDVASFGRLGSKTFMLYIGNTVLAIAAALGVGLILQPGIDANLPITNQVIDIGGTTTPDIGLMIMNIIPSNPVQAFVSGDMLQIIFMAILTGLAIQAMDHKGGPAVSCFKVANDVMTKLVALVMTMAPYGVFALMFQLGATMAVSTLISVASYVALVVVMLIFWIFIVYPFLVWAITGIKPSDFRSKTREQVLFSLSTASSNATIPVTMKTLVENFKVPKSIAGFGVPLGATMNMSGVSIYITLATLFVANATGVSINSGDLLAIGFTVLLLSIGAGGVPGGGVVMIGVMLMQLGLPMEALGIIMAVDRINDMFCTSSNVVGDTAVCVIVAKSENKLRSHI